ncbi:MAG: cyanophycinase [Verrucomicrobiales bacterium]|jgi:cyanophycinase
MKSIFLLSLSVCLFTCSNNLLATERIDPAGIGGSLVISGAGRPVGAHRPFYELAQGKQARVVILRFDSDEFTETETLQILKSWEAIGGRSLEIFRVGGEIDPAAAIASMKSATGVWLVTAELGKLTADFVGDQVQTALHALLDRGGVVGGEGAAADAFSEALDLLPASFIDSQTTLRYSASPVRQALQKQPSLVGYEIALDAALIVTGRRLRVVGDGKVRIHLAASTRRDASVIELGNSRAKADLTALRLAAIARQAEPIPAAQPPSPDVVKGTLIIIGGGGMPKGIISKFVELAGGDEASIVVLPTANPDPISEREGIEGAFRKAGAKTVTVLRGRTLDKVDSEEYLEVLRNATGLWFGGGRQWRFADAYLDTRALAAMHAVLARGGVIMGSSAGASIQADYLARANPLGNLDIMAEGYERGLGFIGGVAIDQHFAQRRRFKDMSSLVDQYPQLLGIGIDEGTALIVEGKIGKVEGKSAVHFYDRNKPVTEGKPDYESVGDGGSYDLVARKILKLGEGVGARQNE